MTKASEFTSSFTFGPYSRFKAEPWYSSRFDGWLWAVTDAEAEPDDNLYAVLTDADLDDLKWHVDEPCEDCGQTPDEGACFYCKMD